jgi:hypothetical protein
MMREATKGALVATSGPGRNDSLPLPLQGLASNASGREPRMALSLCRLPVAGGAVDSRIAAVTDSGDAIRPKTLR